MAESGKEVLISDQVKGAISFKQVSFGYHPEKILIKDLSIDIPAGSKVAIVGPTGAGKSTLINLLMRFIPLTLEISCWMEIHFMTIVVPLYANSLAWCSRNLAQARDHSRQYCLWKSLEASQGAGDLLLPKQPMQTFSSNSYHRDTIPSWKMLESLSLSVSGQLLTIARVFLSIPKILILDEATSSIDTRTEVLVQDAFAKLMKGAYKLYHCPPLVNHSGCGFDSCLGGWRHC